jgi:hypothetical protein
MADAARIVVEQAHPDVLDLNFGCPVKRVAGKGAGAGMLQNVPKMLEITRAVVDAVGSQVPVTVKTRLGWDHEHKIIVPLDQYVGWDPETNYAERLAWGTSHLRKNSYNEYETYFEPDNSVMTVTYTIEDGRIRHDALKTAYLVFSYMMNNE